MSSSESSSGEAFEPRQSEVEHVSESTSTEAQTGQEQRSQGPVGRPQRVSRRDDDLIDNDLLISLVQERVPLWDSRDPLHSINTTLRRLCNEVAQALWDGWDNAPPQVRSAFVDKVRTRWRSMKDRFNKDLRQESRAASGSGARIRLYKYHRVLSFLRPVLAHRATQSTTVEPGSGAVLQPAGTDPSQPSSSAAAGGPSTLTGDKGAGPSGGLHYSANTMTSAVGHPTATTVTTAAPAWTSSTDTTMQQDPGVAFRPGPTTMQQDPGVSFRPGPTTMQQDPGVSFRPGPTTMPQDPGVSFRPGPTTMQQDPGMSF
ncbi:uncharacterized protein LOC143816814 [Ranitomeya variabilis]|uniref:uncharacterized protein LOC143816814 n=1 Tax=Ranitomeya variabilis TaxID=490064 RepID=UPI004057C470